MELDDWDRDWISRPHSDSEYRAKCKELFERCAAYAAEIERLRGQRTGCGYPDCMVDDRCARMWSGECSGPKEVKP
jgi:hypothetical protein